MKTESEILLKQEIKKSFSHNLDYWLKKRGLKQIDLANKLNISKSTVSQWLNPKNRKMPSTETLGKITKVLDVNLSDLLEEKNLQERNELEDEFLKLFNQLTDKEKTILTKQIQAFIDSH